MGAEYLFPCRGIAPGDLGALLRGAPHFARVEPEFGSYEFRSPGNADLSRMPDAHASVAPGGAGLYFCDNGGDPAVAAAVLAHLESALAGAGAPFEPHAL